MKASDDKIQELKEVFKRKIDKEEKNIYQSVIDAFLLTNPELVKYVKEKN